MGQAVERLAAENPQFEVSALWRRGDDLDVAVSSADVIIDFSLPEATESVVAAAVKHGKALVCGVSGLDDIQLAAIHNATASIAVVYDRNMSKGIALLDRAIREAGRALGRGYEVEIHETHHIHKKDAPSGTALKLGESLVEEGAAGSHDDINYESERRGEVPGDHTVILVSATERLEFGHSVTTRDVFAEGALHAAAWIVAQEPGLYSMQDVLFDA